MDLNLGLKPLPLSASSHDPAWYDSLDVQFDGLLRLCGLQGPATLEQRDCVLRQLLAIQQPDGSFPLALGYEGGVDYNALDIVADESDVIQYVFVSTYLVCQILTNEDPFPTVSEYRTADSFPCYSDKRGPRGSYEQVMGELYICDIDVVRRINRALGVANPDFRHTGGYHFFDVVNASFVERDGMADYLLRACTRRVYLYMSVDSVNARRSIPLELQPFSRYAALKKTHVWYVARGVEQNLAAFMRLLAACDDPTPPVCDCKKSVPFALFEGVEHEMRCDLCKQEASETGWVGTVTYLVTRAQAQQIARARGVEASPVDGCPCTLDLGVEAGIPVVAYAPAECVAQARKVLAAGAH